MITYAMNSRVVTVRQVQIGNKQVQQAVRRVLRDDEEADEATIPAAQRATSRAVRSSWLFPGSAEKTEARDDAR